ncbi:uncharacterized protein LOC141855150 isoform X2 [Brevipalpus obovatus]|uniref:uncharacterized protein LOC141855150 isoform X2 n=1 Tax=Brevipalpus obovatus TaxID=246614 RepID=UPI003D9EC55F
MHTARSHLSICMDYEGDPNRNIYWDIQLDPDLLQTLVGIYPEWFTDYNLDLMGEEGVNFPLLNQDKPLNSPPKAEVDNASIRMSMDKNKESLKLKLMLRRPIQQLVEQGILPPLNHSPNFYEQSKKLERARMENFLKHKIQRRPDRQALIQKHILEDTTVSPTIHSKQRQLKKARLADDLNDRLSHRPGPLELVKGNILLTDEKFAQAVKQGQIQFKATCEGEPIKYPPPRFVIEEETSSDDAASPSQSRMSEKSIAVEKDCSLGSDFIQHLKGSELDSSNSIGSSKNSVEVTPCSTMTLNQVTSIMAPNLQNQTISPGAFSPFSPPASVPAAPVSQILPGFSVASPQSVSTGATIIASSPSSVSSPSNSSSSIQTPNSVGKESAQILTKNRKKSKSKSQPKTKTIKFHEYKGPPSAQKSQSLANNSSESSYELLLKQQQLFLQWQLEWQQKYPQIILPPAQKNNLDQGSGTNGQISTNSTMTPIILTTSRPSMSTETVTSNAPPATGSNESQTQNGSSKMILKLEDMKVSDLKCELKKRNLPVSGSKPQLIERLKPFVDSLLHSAGMPRTNQKCEQSACGNGSQKSGDTISEDTSRSEEPVPMSPNSINCKVDSERDKPSVSEKEPVGSPMELDNSSLANQSQNVSIDKLQQQRIKDLQRGQFHLQFQNQPVFTSTIPLSALTNSQIQIVATSASNENMNFNSKPCSKQIFQTSDQNKTIIQPSNLTAIISPASTSTVVLSADSQPKTSSGSFAKANLALFLNRHASINQQNQNGQNQTSQHHQQISNQPILTQQNATQQLHIPQFVTSNSQSSPQTQTVGLISTNGIQTSDLPSIDPVSFTQTPIILSKPCDPVQYSTSEFKTEPLNVSQNEAGSKIFSIKQPTFTLPLLTTQMLEPVFNSKLIQPTFQRVFLYQTPTTCTSTDSMNSQTESLQQRLQQNQPTMQISQHKSQIREPASTSVEIFRAKQTRTNSLPNELNPLNSVSIRAPSLPNFSSFVTTSPESYNTDSNIQVKPPPAYEEATKDLAKESHNQAFDDVIEILMRNGEFPVPMDTNDSNNNNNNNNNNSNNNPKEEQKLFDSSSLDASLYLPNSCQSVPTEPLKDQSQVTIQIAPAQASDNLDNIFGPSFETVNSETTITKVDNRCSTGSPSGIRNTTENSRSIESSSKSGEQQQQNPIPNSNFEVTGGDLLLNEFMELQESPMNVDYPSWLSELMTDSNQVNQKINPPLVSNSKIINNNSFVKSHPFFNSLDCDTSKGPFTSNSFSSSSSSRTSTDRDPVLANHIVENSGDPIMDFYGFDMESDCKETNDLINLVWDRIDFAA